MAAAADAAWVALTSDRTVLELGETATLTATTNAPAKLEFVDVASGSVIKSCSSGTTCTMPVLVYRGDPVSYRARVGTVVSDIVTVSRAPWTVELAADRTEFAAGDTVELRAVPNQDVSKSSAYRVSIVDVTTSTVLAQCYASDTRNWANGACTTKTSFSKGAPHTYRAYVSEGSSFNYLADFQATSSDVSVGRAPWSVALAADRQTFRVGEQVTLTATPNQDIIKSAYRLSIVDVTSGSILRQCYSSSTTGWVDGSCSVATSFTRGGPHTYRAYVSDGTSVSNLSNIEATSADITAERAPWTVTLTSDRTTFAAGETVRLTATPNQDLASSSYELSIVDQTAGRVLTQCLVNWNGSFIGGWDGTACSTTTSFATGDPHAYQALVANGSSVSTLTSIQATSEAVSAGRQPWSISLTSDRAQFAIGEKYTLSARPNQDITKSGYRLSIVDQTTNAVVQQCYSGTTTGWVDGACTLVTSFDTGLAHTYRAYVAENSALPLTNVQAQSADVAVERMPWTVELTADREEFAAGDKVTLTATPNQDVTKGAAYRVYIADVTLNKTIAVCNDRSTTAWDGTSCSVQTSFETGPAHVYRAYISRGASYGGSPVVGQPIAELTDVQTVSADIAAARQGWTAGLSMVRSADGKQITLTAVANQDIKKAMPYRLIIQDVTGNDSLTVCHGWGGLDQWTSCEITLTAPSTPRVYRAYVADGPRSTTNAPVGGRIDQLRDVQAVSRDVRAASIGPTMPGETAGGSNPSQACSQRCHGDPVNSVTGEFWESTTDLTTVGAGPTIGVNRSYAASRSSVAGPFGYGWSFDLGMSLVPRGGTALATSTWVDVVQENGSIATFARDETGAFSAPERTFATLKRTEDGGYRFTRRGTQTFSFDDQGRLQALGDRNDNTVDVVRGADDRITGVQDDTGRSVAFTWAGDRVTQVSDHTGRTIAYAYSAAGDLTTVTLPDGSTLRYEYDAKHQITALIDQVGGRTANTYDASGRVTLQVDPLGGELRFAYADGQTTVTNPDGSVTIERHQNGQVLSETLAAGTEAEATMTYTYSPTNQVATMIDPLGQETTYTYDSAGNRTSTTDPLGRTETATFDVFGNLLTNVNPAGETTTSAYDEHGNLLSRTDPTGAVTSFTVNADGTIATATDPLGRMTSFAYDVSGNLVSTTAPDGAETTATYDPVGNLTSASDPRQVGAPAGAFTSQYGYDAQGRTVSVLDGTGANTAYVYDAAGQLVQSTNPTGAVTSAEYDPAGQMTATVDAEGGRTAYTYDGAGRVETITEPGGGTTTYAYDAAGNQVSVTDPLGRVTRTEYDLLGRAVAVVSPSGARTTTTYDAAGQATSVTAPDGTTTTTTYDAAGRVKTVTDADGRAITNAYDAAGRRTSLTRADGSTLTWTYDADGRLSAATNADGQATTYTYDAHGNPTSRTTALGTTSLTYDAAGNLASQTAPDGTLTTYTNDAANRVTAIDYPDGTPDVTYDYDPAGRLTSTTDGTGSSTRTYDDLGRLKTETRAGAQVAYEWDADGNLVALTYPDGTRTTSTFDAAGQLDLVSDPAAGTFDYDWSPDGQIEHIAFPNGVSTDLDHDTVGQLTASTTTGQDGATLLDLAYSYTDAGLLAEQTVAHASTSLAWQYGWDARGVLDQVTGTATGDVSLTAGGAVTALEDGTTLSYTSSASLESTTRDGATTTYTADARGNRTSRTAPAPDDTAASATDPGPRASTDPRDSGGDTVIEATSSSTTPDGNSGATDTYGWDTADRLATASVGDTDTSYTYFADGLRASSTAEGVTTSFAWDTQATVSRLLADGTHRYVYGASGAPIAQIASDGAVSYLHGDMTGSIRTVTDLAGAVIAASDYSTYGVESPSDGVAVSRVTAFGYAGEYTDSTGLIYLRARYYDPATAQFLSIDAFADLTQMPYGYTDGNPLQLVDPLGLAWWNPLDWDPDILDTVSSVAGGAAAILAVTGVGAPVGAVLGAVAVGASGLSTVNRIRNGDEFIDIALSGVGVVTGGTGAVASRFGQLMVRTARSASMYTRVTGSAGRGVADVMETVDVLSYTPLVFAGGVRSAYCASVIW